MEPTGAGDRLAAIKATAKAIMQDRAAAGVEPQRVEVVKRRKPPVAPIDFSAVSGLPDGEAVDADAIRAAILGDAGEKAALEGQDGADPKGVKKIGFAPRSMLKRKADLSEIVGWVAANLAIQKPSYLECPAAEAWAMLKWVRMNKANETAFWRTLFAKMIPSGVQIGGRKSFRDNGEAVLERIDQVLALEEKAQKAVKTGTRGSAELPPVPLIDPAATAEQAP